MFERFTTDARSVVVGAQDAARRSHAPAIDSGHLLAALAAQPGTPATRALAACGVRADDLAAPDGALDAEALASLGIDLAAVTARTDEVFGPGALEGAARARRGHLPFSREAKKTLELSLREAVRLKDRGIDSRHLLLAMLRQREAVAAGRIDAALRASGSDPDALRGLLEAPVRAA